MNWVGFGIAVLILDIIPVWFLNFFNATLINRLFLTVVLAVIIWFFVERRGTK